MDKARAQNLVEMWTDEVPGFPNVTKELRRTLTGLVAVYMDNDYPAEKMIKTFAEPIYYLAMILEQSEPLSSSSQEIYEQAHSRIEERLLSAISRQKRHFLLFMGSLRADSEFSSVLSGDIDNKKRALLAQRALEAFSSLTGQTLGSDEEVAEVVMDLLCDLMHFCYQHELSFDDLLSRAIEHFEEELEEERLDTADNFADGGALTDDDQDRNANAAEA